MILGHVKCVPDHGKRGQENEKKAVRGQEMPAWRGRGRDDTAVMGEIGRDSSPVPDGHRPLTRPISNTHKGNQARRMGPLAGLPGPPLRALDTSWQAWARPRWSGPRRPTAVDTNSTVCSTAGEAAMPNGKLTDRHGPGKPGSGWTHRDPAPGF